MSGIWRIARTTPVDQNFVDGVHAAVDEITAVNEISQ